MGHTVQQRSQLIRVAVYVVLFLAILTVAGLVLEWIDVIRGMPIYRGARLLVLGAANLLFTVCLAATAALYYWTRMARSLPDLKNWHVQKPESEFRAVDATDDYTLDDYREQEDCVFAELDAYIAQSWSKQAAVTYNRFNPRSVCHPANVDDRNWNRTHITKAANPIGGALLLHGLSDSPYSLRAMGQRLHAEGYTVVWLRLPGHGTNPRALAEVSWEDWTAVVRIAMKELRDQVPADLPLIAVGYSNGGALSLHYALASVDDPTLPPLDALVLFSPMIGVNPLARITRLYHAVGLVSRSEKARWSNVYAEIDPFKFNSWPMNGNVQAWNLTRAVERKLVALEKSGRMNTLPPVLAMQSVVDSTVVVPKLITVLFDRLTSESSELFLFDVNRVDSLSNLLNLSFERSIAPKLERTDHPFKLTVMGNAQSDSRRLLLRVRHRGQRTEEPVDLVWPEGIVSLSHVAIPFPPDDPVYGRGSDTGGPFTGNAQHAFRTQRVDDSHIAICTMSPQSLLRFHGRSCRELARSESW